MEAAGKKLAKPCNRHIGGKLGTLILNNFVEKGWITKDKPGDKYYYITEKGQNEFTRLGIDLSQIKSEEQ